MSVATSPSFKKRERRGERFQGGKSAEKFIAGVAVAASLTLFLSSCSSQPEDPAPSPGSGETQATPTETTPAPETASLAELVATGVSWGSPEVISDLPNLRGVAEVNGRVVAGITVEGKGFSALTVDPLSREVTLHEFDGLPGKSNIRVEVTDDSIWALNQNTGALARFDIEGEFFEGPSDVPEVTETIETATSDSSVWLVPTSDGRVFLTRRDMLWEVDSQSPGRVLSATNLTDLGVDIGVSPRIYSAGRYILIDTRNDWYLLEPDSGELQDLAEAGIAKPSAASIIDRSQLPMVDSDTVMIVSGDREIVLVNLDTLATESIADVPVTTAKVSGATNPITGIDASDGRLLLAAGNHSELALIETESGQTTTLPTSRSSKAMTQALIVADTVWTWQHDGHDFGVWAPSSEANGQ